MWNKIKKILPWLDYLAILLGATSLLLSIFGYDCPRLIYAAGAVCFLYSFYALLLLICERPRLDWALIRGNLLRKVAAYVLLVPSFITSVILSYENVFSVEYSTKNIVYAESLYECEHNVDTIGVVNNKALADPLFLEAHGLALRGDSVVVRNHKLSEREVGNQQPPSILWTVFYHFVDPGNQDMATSQSGRGWVAIIAMLGVLLLNGLLVSSIVDWFGSRREKWLNGSVKYPWFIRCIKKQHYVIIGGNDMSIGVVKQIFDKHGKTGILRLRFLPYIIIQTSRDVQEFRRKLFSELTEEQQKHIIIYYGSRTSDGDLKDLCLHKACEIYILGEQTRTDELEPYHDTLNMQCFDLIASRFNKGNNRQESVKCYVMFEYQTSFAAFQSSHQPRILSTGEKGASNYRELEFIPFSTYESWAQTLLVRGEVASFDGDVIRYNKIDGGGISYDSDKRVHLIVVGMSKMGTAMAIETAHLAHFPNFMRDKSKRTKITFIDKNVREESNFFMGRFPDLFKMCKWTDADGVVHNNYAPQCAEYSYFGQNFIDIEWEFRDGGVESKENRNYINACFEKGCDDIVTIAVCLPWPHQSLAAALYLPKIALVKANDIWVYQPQSDSLISDINKCKRLGSDSWSLTTYNKLKPFGMLNLGFDPKLLDNDAIKYCESFYKVPMELQKMCLSVAGEKSGTAENVCCWDSWNREIVEAVVSSLKVQDCAMLWSVWSNIYQLNTIEFKLRSLGGEFDYVENGVKKCLLDNADVKVHFAQVEHNRWNVEKLLMGYRPMADIVLDEAELADVKAYLKIDDFAEEEVRQKDLYYDRDNHTYKFKAVKKFYKDGPMKIHPNICPFDWLPMEDKNYDICFTLAMPFLKKKLDNN